MDALAQTFAQALAAETAPRAPSPIAPRPLGPLPGPAVSLGFPSQALDGSIALSVARVAPFGDPLAQPFAHPLLHPLPQRLPHFDAPFEPGRPVAPGRPPRQRAVLGDQGRQEQGEQQQQESHGQVLS